MQDLRPRDYIIGALIILGVLSAWFLLIASLMGFTNPQLGLPLSIVIGLIVYIFLKRRNRKT